MHTPGAPTITLPRGAEMPLIGFGTWPMYDDEAATAVAEALRLGYRLIDTAENYQNERGVGEGLRASGVPREDVFITTKFNRKWHTDVPAAFEASAARLGTDYIDLLLIHWPNPGHDRYVAAWQGLLDLMKRGHVRAIGTSNFKPAHLDRLLAETGELPDVNQIELNPQVARDAARAYAAAHGIVTESWSPIGKGGDLLAEPAIAAIVERYGKTRAQVVLRWHLELGLVAIPKSSSPLRMAENLEVFDFALTPEEVASISALDRGESAAADSDLVGH